MDTREKPILESNTQEEALLSVCLCLDLDLRVFQVLFFFNQPIKSFNRSDKIKKTFIIKHFYYA